MMKTSWMFMLIALVFLVGCNSQRDYIESIELESKEVEEGDVFKVFLNVKNPHWEEKEFCFILYYDDDVIKPYQYADKRNPLSFCKTINKSTEQSYYVDFEAQNITMGQEVTQISFVVTTYFVGKYQDEMRSNFILVKKSNELLND